jgi:hypothetical protein
MAALKSFLCVGLFCLIATTASADSFSFGGTFQTDNDVQLFTITVASPITATFLTLSYGGAPSVAAPAQTVPAGGFAPDLWLFDSTGTNVAEFSAYDTSGEVNDGVGGYLDDYDTYFLATGTYTLALTEFTNYPVDGYLIDGFADAGNPYCDFCDSSSDQMDSNWSVDVLNVDSASEQLPSTGTPEPGSLILLSSGLGCFSWVRRRKFFRAE